MGVPAPGIWQVNRTHPPFLTNWTFSCTWFCVELSRRWQGESCESVLCHNRNIHGKGIRATQPHVTSPGEMSHVGPKPSILTEQETICMPMRTGCSYYVTGNTKSTCLVGRAQKDCTVPCLSSACVHKCSVYSF